MTLDVVDLYIRASAEFGQQVVATGDDQWALPTPCPEWDIRAVVAHVVLGEAQVPEVVAGRPVLAAEMDISILGPDPVSAWRGTALSAIQAVRGADLTAELERLLGFRITDNLVHAWDVATARGDLLELDPEIAAWCLDFWLPLTASLEGSEYFGPMVEPSEQTPGARLLGLLGRSA